MTSDDLRSAIRSIPDFPNPGILFRDISPILESAPHFHAAIDLLAGQCEGLEPVKVVGLDARGFIFGAALAYRLGLGFVPVRKKGKLPFRTISHAYDLEYGSAEFEIHCDSILQLGANVLRVLFVVELEGLGGRDQLAPLEVCSLVSFGA